MERKIYQPTEKQEQKWATIATPTMPTDDEFRAMWKKAHHGKISGWGLGKRQWIIGSMSGTREYQMGIWQGRVDAARKLDYAEKLIDDENANCYNLGYYRGYVEFESNWRGWDAGTRQRFAEQYINA